jgi:hypothetical protein
MSTPPISITSPPHPKISTIININHIKISEETIHETTIITTTTSQDKTETKTTNGKPTPHENILMKIHFSSLRGFGNSTNIK